ncbi:hypothetical protein ACSBR2_038087 [Camellia fascicularis]
MASGGHHNQEGVPEDLRNQLAVAVRTIQWSYAIFWSNSSRQPGVLEWGDGYYNGDIKTRKTVQAVEFNADQLGLQRSEQLRELYESLSAGESSPQARRPSAALSPEDLTDTEWLPGRTLANGQPIWLCNAHYADSKVFSRSLLAKPLFYWQTVVCFPFLGGVVELGVTDLILEDPGFIQHIKTSFLEIPYPIVYNASDKDLIHATLDRDILDDTNFNPIVGCEELNVCSPNNSSNKFGLNEESFMVEGLNDEFSNCVHNSMSSSDCISQTLVSPEKVCSFLKGQNENDGFLLDLQEQNQMKPASTGLQDNDIHYQSVLSTLLKTSHQLILGPNVRNCNQESSFVSWKKCSFVGIQMPRIGTPQRLLKKVLFEVAQMHSVFLLDSRENNGERDGLWRPQVDDIDSNHVLSERRRREKINKRFSVLGSLVPSTSKVNKVSILDNTIKYLKDLERRVEELDSCKEVVEQEARTRRKPQDSAERTSDNYANNIEKPLINKRKACDIGEIEPEINQMVLKNSSNDSVTVSMIEKDVLIEVRCPWRECLLLEIMDAISHLHLDSYSIQSTNTDGILSLTVKSKFKGSKVASARIIRQALQRVVRK